MANRSIYCALFLLLVSCSTKQQPSQESDKSIEQFYDRTATELTEEQRTAFDALNLLQINTDEKSRLYSTFANISQPCYPPDTNIIISQSEFLGAMEAFIARHCRDMDTFMQKELGHAAVLSQKQYNVLHCSQNARTEDYTKGLPRTGTWIMPGVLGKRDIILEW